MLTTLLLLLGLSGAGAGAYSLFRSDPKTESEKEVGRPQRRNRRPGTPANFETGKSPETPKQISKDPEAPKLEEKKRPEEIPRTGEKPKVTYLADDIVPNNSKYSFHRRPILHAEALLEKMNVDGAKEIYERTESRIPDKAIKEKINQNIKDLNEFLFGPEKTDEEDEENFFSGKSEIPFSDLVSAIKELSMAFAETLERSLQRPIIPQAALPGNFPQVLSPLKPNETGERIPGLFAPPIVYQIVSPPPNLPQSFPPDSPPIDKQKLDDEVFFPPTPETEDKKDERDDDKTEEAKAPEETQDPLSKLTEPEESPFSEFGDLDLPLDTFFTEEWEKFKNLPLKNRRGEGKDRREGRSDSDGKDRRSDDRRKNDLFQEREEYLKRKAEEKRREREAQKAKLQDERAKVPLSEVVKPFYPQDFSQDLLKIDLPDPTSERISFGKQDEIFLEKVDLPTPKEISRIPKFVTGLPEGEDDVRSVLEEFKLKLPDGKEQFREQSEKEKAELPDGETSFARSENPLALPEAIESKLIDSKFDLPDALENRLEEPPPERPPYKAKEFDSPHPDPGSLSKDLTLVPIDLPNPYDIHLDDGPGKKESTKETSLTDDFIEPESPEVEAIEGDLGEIEEIPEPDKLEKEPEKILHGILELKPPEQDDAPFLTLTYDFGKIPDSFRLSKNYSIMEYSYYKYKPMLMKAQEFARRKMLKNALNYYRVIKSQNIPTDLRKMINRNIEDITEFLEKYLMAKG